MSFIDVHIYRQMAILRMLYFVTLTYNFKINTLEI